MRVGQFLGELFTNSAGQFGSQPGLLVPQLEELLTNAAILGDLRPVGSGRVFRKLIPIEAQRELAVAQCIRSLAASDAIAGFVAGVL